MSPRHATAADRKPTLDAKMHLADFTGYYWFKSELAEFAKRLKLKAHGCKPELSARIERRLRGVPDHSGSNPTHVAGPRDSEKGLRRDTPVVYYKSDAKTRG